MREILKASKNNEVNINLINQALNEFINLRTITNIYLFNKKGEIYLNFKDKENVYFLNPSEEIYN